MSWRALLATLVFVLGGVGGIHFSAASAQALPPSISPQAVDPSLVTLPIVLDPCEGTTATRGGVLTPQSPFTVASNGLAETTLLAGGTVFQYDNRGNRVFENGEINTSQTGAGGLPYCSSRLEDDGTVVAEWAFCIDKALAGCANNPLVPEEDWGSTQPSRPITETKKAQIAFLLAAPDLQDKRSRAILQTQIWCISEGYAPGTVQADARNYFNGTQFQSGASDPRSLPLTDAETRCLDVPVLPATPTLSITADASSVDAGDAARFSIATNLTTPITLSGADVVLCPAAQPGVSLSGDVLTLAAAGSATVCATSDRHELVTLSADSGDVGLPASIAIAWSMRSNCQSFISYRAGDVARLQESASVQFVGRGTFEVLKDYDYSGTLTPGDLDDVEIDITYTVQGTPPAGLPAQGTLTLTPENGFAATGPMYPVGTVLSLSESYSGSILPPSLEWQGAVWQVDGIAVTPPPTITIADNTVTSITLTNSLTDRLGTFEVVKTFVDQSLDLSGVTVTVEWEGGGASGAIVLDAANGFSGMPEAGGDVVLFPLGTQVLLTETTVTGLPGGVSFVPDWAGNTVPGSSPPQGAVTVAEEWDAGAGQATLISLTNGLNDTRGSLQVRKELAGDPGLSLGQGALDDVVIEVTATWAGGSTVLLLTPDNGWSTGLGYDLAPGTEVTLEETAIYSSAPSIAWQPPPGWTCDSGSQCVDNGDGTTTVTIGTGTDAAVALVNSATVLLGGFVVEKRVFGDLEIDDPRLASTVYTVKWTSSETPAQSGTILLDQAGAWQGAPTLSDGSPASFPLGTTITLRETGIDPADPGLAWSTDPEWSPGDQGDGSTQITITDSTQPVELFVTNFLQINEGRFSVEKLVHSTGQLPLDGIVFLVEYGDGAAITDTLRVEAGERAESPVYPAGTVLTLQEAQPVPVPGVAGTWDAPVFITEDGTRSPGTVTIVIGAGENVLIDLENTFQETPPTPPTPEDPPKLAVLGGDSGSQFALAALVLLLAGGALLVIARRRRTR